MLNLGRNNKTPLAPQKINMLGRKRYSVDSNMADVIEGSFDDCLKAIGRLWAIVIIMGLLIYKLIFRGNGILGNWYKR